MVKIKNQKPVKVPLDGKEGYFIRIPKHVVDRLGIDDDTEVESVVSVFRGKVWSSCKSEWVK